MVLESINLRAYNLSKGLSTFICLPLSNNKFIETLFQIHKDCFVLSIFLLIFQTHQTKQNDNKIQVANHKIKKWTFRIIKTI